MTYCPVTNAASISCAYGCCGTTADQYCCPYTLSEDAVIVICVVGALVVIAVLVALVICLTSTHNDRVVPIQPLQRRNMYPNETQTRRSRLVEFPKPPPYSEVPPLYEPLPGDSGSIPGSTDIIIPGYRTHGGRGRTQPGNRRHNPETDPPPPYISVMQLESNNNPRCRRDSPVPGTSGLGDNLSSRHSGASNVHRPTERTRHGSPHPSLASGRISMYNRSNTLHRTISGSSLPVVDRRQLGMISNNNSVTPVTIRVITVHTSSQKQNSTSVPRASNRNEASHNKRSDYEQVGTKIPRPLRQQKVEPWSETNKPSTDGSGLFPGAYEDDSRVITVEDSPPPMNPTAAARSANRKAVLHRLQQRKGLISPITVQ